MVNKLYTGLTILFGALFIFSGLNKFFNFVPMPPMPEASANDFKAMMEISWLIPLVAIAEIVGGLLIMLPKTRALAALILTPVMVGILLANTLVDTSGMPMAIVLTGILGWVIYQNWSKFTNILN